MITVGMYVTLGEAFTVLRNRRGYSVHQAAERAGLPVAIVESIELDDYEATRMNDTVALAGVYDLCLSIRLISESPQLVGLNNDKDEETNSE